MSSSSSSAVAAITRPSPVSKVTRQITFALLPVLSDTRWYRYYWNRLIAWSTARPDARSYVHCELVFEDHNAFGLTSDGIQWRLFTSMRTSYQCISYAVFCLKKKTLYEKCRAAAEADSYVCSTVKAILDQLGPLGRLATWLLPRRVTYCSELLVRLLSDSGIDIGLPTHGASPNDIGWALARHGSAGDMV
jgi:hypothetical protein